MSKPFAVFDIDGTLIRWQLYHAIAGELARQGQISAAQHTQIKTARMEWKKRVHPEAFKDYELQLVTVYEEILKDLLPAQFDKAVAAVIEEYKQQAYTYTRSLVVELKAQGYMLFAVSGSQAEPISKLAEHYGFDDYVGTDFVRQNAHFTGEIIYHAKDKKKVLESLVKKHQLDYKGSLAIGDSASDAAILEMVEQPIAFNPDQSLFKIAQKNSWKIVVERKNVIYEMECRNGNYLLA